MKENRKQRNKIETYEAMTIAIDFMRINASKHPSVLSIAKAVGMSVSRFEHIFLEWAGTTPKRFLSHLNKEVIKKNISKSKDILTAAYSSGLSSPSRLHELMVTYEAVTPGEFKSGNIEIVYGIHESPFGWCLIALTKRGVCQIAFLDIDDNLRAEKIIHETWPRASLSRSDALTKSYADKIFKSHSSKPIHLFIKGTNFQIKVWEALLKIPEGKTSTYTKIAKQAGSSKAVRAVGSACGKNPIGFLIPCHRVLTSSGKLGGYHWGTKRKEAILAWESIRRSK